MTIVVDSSALACIVLGEPEAPAMASALIAQRGDVRLSAATAVEVAIVVEARQGPAASDDLQRLLTILGVTVDPLDAAQAELAVGAWRRFGRGGHAAALDFGDCFAYALAKHLGAPLLFTGRGFEQTDVSSAQ